ncbi:MAG: hypothetical protein GY873_30280 [Bosea sp.]|uniref:hypothetical protein n=1 Tax=Bosea sp. (in: a-proteobacteria) TaxID=1871050 RepID=UPI00238667B0|nr:hypothetical protein [Bosea sp. (in: a-proteobacteria)]MCP4738484.1 hypothetical protein [Bosea sp. (in: a-proteobacteria)]
MDRRPLPDEAIARRCAAMVQVQQTTEEIGRITSLIRDRADPNGLALGPLASAARQGWAYAKFALIQADGGMPSVALIDAIARRDPAITCPNLRRLAETTLLSAEARLHGRAPEPAPMQMEAAR